MPGCKCCTNPTVVKPLDDSLSIEGSGTPLDPYLLSAKRIIAGIGTVTTVAGIAPDGGGGIPLADLMDVLGLPGGVDTSNLLTQANNLNDLASKPTARKNLGVARMVTPEEYGATGDGTTDDTAAFQAAVNALTSTGGGIIWLTARTYVVGGLILKSNVSLRSAGRSTIIPPAAFTGWIIDTPATPKQTNMGLFDLTISGGITGSTSPNTGGVRFQLTSFCRMQNVSIGATSLGSFRQVAGQATQLIGCSFGNYFNWRTLTTYEGALYLAGTDHLVFGCECNAENQLSVTYPSTFYRCGMVIAGGTIWVIASNGEYSDVGIMVTGSTNRFIGARGDVNAGHGIMVKGTLNYFTNTMVGSNSIGSPGDYDGIYLDAGAYGCVIDGVTEFPDFTASTQHRYVVNDQVDIFADAKSAPQLPTVKNIRDAQGYKYRKLNQLYPYRAVEDASIGSPVARPPARYAAGTTFYDTVNNKPCFSDGSLWRDAGGYIVGNLLNPRTALMNDPAEIGWTTYSGGSGTTSVAGVNGWSKHKRARALEVTASGSSTVAGAQMKAVYRVTNVTAGETYSLALTHLGVTQLASLSCQVVWYDAGGVQIGAPVTTASQAQTVANTAQDYSATGLVAPAGAVQANILVLFTRTGMASGEKYQFSKVALVPGAAPGGFVEP